MTHVSITLAVGFVLFLIPGCQDKKTAEATRACRNKLDNQRGEGLTMLSQPTWGLAECWHTISRPDSM